MDFKAQHIVCQISVMNFSLWLMIKNQDAITVITSFYIGYTQSNNVRKKYVAV